MAGANTPSQIRRLVREDLDRGPVQKIRRKPKFNPNVDKRNSNKNKLKESFGSEGV